MNKEYKINTLNKMKKIVSILLCGLIVASYSCNNKRVTNEQEKDSLVVDMHEETYSLQIGKDTRRTAADKLEKKNLQVESYEVLWGQTTDTKKIDFLGTKSWTQIGCEFKSDRLNHIWFSQNGDDYYHTKDSIYSQLSDYLVNKYGPAENTFKLNDNGATVVTSKWWKDDLVYCLVKATIGKPGAYSMFDIVYNIAPENVLDSIMGPSYNKYY